MGSPVKNFPEPNMEAIYAPEDAIEQVKIKISTLESEISAQTPINIDNNFTPNLSVTSSPDSTKNQKLNTINPNTIEKYAGSVTPPGEECISDAEVMQDVESTETESSNTYITQDVKSTKKKSKVLQ